ncbi:MAG: ABC transporter ATP-binding protein [Mesorhizobium sp.]
MTGQTLAASGLVLTYPEAGRGRMTAVNGAALDARPGSMTALAGPSGSGKSTLLYLLSGLMRPDAGSIRWNDTNLANLGEARRDAWRRNSAGFVFQNFHLIEEMSPEDNVLVGGWFAQWSVRRLRRRGAELLDRLEVPRERTKVALLSRGEQQRVAIARALLFDPPVIFADEPTASLDIAAGQNVVSVLRRLASEAGKTIICASHDADLLDACDHVVRIEHGKIVALQTAQKMAAERAS